MSKIIGIPGYKQTDSNGFGVGNNHLQFVSKFGNPRIIMPWEEYVKVDLLYLPGGLDLSPATYNDIPGFNTTNHDVFKEFFFHKRLDNYINSGTPIFGVCLGFQMLAVKFGSKLTQDLMFHAQSSGRWSLAHYLYSSVNFGSVVSKKSKTDFEVNSHHHQGVVLENLSSQLTPLLYADNEDSSITGEGPLVEAFKHVNLKIAGVQWHPEELYDEYSMNLIKNLLND